MSSVSPARDRDHRSPRTPLGAPGPSRGAWDFALMVLSASVGVAVILLAAARLVQALR
jgi:hypothetical protein